VPSQLILSLCPISIIPYKTLSSANARNYLRNCSQKEQQEQQQQQPPVSLLGLDDMHVIVKMANNVNNHASKVTQAARVERARAQKKDTCKWNRGK
jgi:hypothetical protein